VTGPLQVWDRAAGELRPEPVLDERALRLLYGSWPGRLLARWVLARRPFSCLHGWRARRPGSARQIAPFVARYGVELEAFEPGPFTSFQDFFTRRFRPGARPFDPDPAVLPAGAEARYLGWERLDLDQPVSLKGSPLQLRGLLTPELARVLAGGPALIGRLAPQDYHRVHYPDDGEVLAFVRQPGVLHAVNPISRRAEPRVLCLNERHVTLLATEHLGQLALVEIGAMTVGRIVTGQQVGDRVVRGAEKAVFHPGASTIVVLGEPGAWRPAADVAEHTGRGLETLVRLGQPVGMRPDAATL
jgi:phosphatidylserine decarboxylase